MSDLENAIVNLLSQSLNPQYAKSVEAQLEQLQNSTPDYPLILLNLLTSPNAANDIKLAAAITFKNLIKNKWIDIDGRHLLTNVDLIRSNIIECMIELPQILKSQVGEAISIIAESDFPEFWPNLIPELVSKLSLVDFGKNLGVLTVAHEVFKRWRDLARSDELFLEILKVLNEFQDVFMKLFIAVDEQIELNSNNAEALRILFENLYLLIEIYYDLNCQDIPEFFEEHMEQGFGIILKYLNYNNKLLEPVDDLDEDEDDSEITILIKCKCSIQELLYLYSSKYCDVFGPLIGKFVETTWELLSSMKPLSKNDLLVCNSMEFLSSVARINEFSPIFNNENGHLNLLLEKIILPNLMLHQSDIELFEDDPIEFVRRDLEGSDIDTRRRACTDFLKVLKRKNLVELTQISVSLITNFLNLYKQDPVHNWKYKDLAIYFYLAIAVEGQVISFGCVETNAYVDVLEFFKENIAIDLSEFDSKINPIILVDAIKYIYVFRNQVGKENIKTILPFLATFLTNDNYVVYTYSAVTLERILSMRESRTSNKFIFEKQDLAGAAEPLITNLFKLILKDSSKPEKLAENEFLMKSIYKICSIAQDSLNEFSNIVLKQLIEILTLIKSNPSNPRFTHYTFEAIGINIKNQLADKSNINKIIETIMPSILNFLADDVTEFIPYSFQLLSFIVENTPDNVPLSVQIAQLSQPLLTPSVWELRGNIPATTRFLVSLLKKDPTIYSDIQPILGLFQKLINSKKLFYHGFEILEALLIKVNTDVMTPYLKSILGLILGRLQNKDMIFIKRFIVFIAQIVLYKSNDFNFVVQWFDTLQQDGVLKGVFNNIILANVDKLNNLFEKKIALSGLLTFVLKSNMLLEKHPDLVKNGLDTLLPCIAKQVHGTGSQTTSAPAIDLDTVEEISTFGSAYSKLITISKNPIDDPLPFVKLENNSTNNFGNFINTELLQPNSNLLKQLGSTFSNNELQYQINL
ncbi:hypothetical protein ACO0SA_000355 [Hanseniaspora valbyensis]